MAANGGFIQYGESGPATGLLPKDAVAWLIAVQNPAEHGWIFVGRWLFVDRPEGAETLGEMRKLVGSVEDTFAALYPLWLSVYSS